MRSVEFSEDFINEIISLSSILEAKKHIDCMVSGAYSFTFTPSDYVRGEIEAKFGLTLTSVPMRWIKGDTAAHIDRGCQSFENTYLVYLTDSPGKLIIDGVMNPITKGMGYIFSEGLRHETVETGDQPRLLLGPISEAGFAVGSSISAPQGTTIYFRQTTDLEYRIGDSGSWTGVGNNYPIGIANSTSSPTEVIRIEFLTNITFDDTVAQGIYKYFICNSSHIQFGSSLLNPDGSRPTIIIDCNNYAGLIQNGDQTNPGFSNVYIYNLVVAGSGRICDIGAGWIGRKGFGNRSTNNFIINCSSSGDIGDNGGGIVGTYASQIGTLNIIGCSSYGNIGTQGGGIVGTNAAALGSVTCKQCWSEGQIGSQAGGIFGYASAGTAIKCYSIGGILNLGGGIFGDSSGPFPGNPVIARNCYSMGAIAINAGGIFGSNAGVGSPTQAINCYSFGTLIISGSGIYGNGIIRGTETNCYVGDGSFVSSIAHNQLQGAPSGSIGAGTSWISTAEDIPYEINGMGFTPYNLTNIDSVTNELIQDFSQSIQVGQTTNTAINPDASGNNFIIIQKTGGNASSYGTITISAQTGAVSTTSATTAGTYILTIRSVGSYNTTTLTLTVTGGGETTVAGAITCCSLTLDLNGLDYDVRDQILGGTAIIANTSQPRQPRSYSDIYNMKKAYAARR